MMKMKSSEVLSLISILVTVIGLALVVWQVRLAVEQLERAELNQRGQYLAALHERAFGAPDIQDIVTKIEYNSLRYDADFHGSDDQAKLVQLLSFFELLAELKDLNLLHQDEIEGVFGYYIRRTRENPVVDEYLTFLRNEWGRPGIGFNGFERLAQSITPLSSGETGK